MATIQTAKATYKGYLSVNGPKMFRVELCDFNPGAGLPAGVMIGYPGSLPEREFRLGRTYLITFDRKTKLATGEAVELDA